MCGNSFSPYIPGYDSNIPARCSPIGDAVFSAAVRNIKSYSGFGGKEVDCEGRESKGSI